MISRVSEPFPDLPLIVLGVGLLVVLVVGLAMLALFMLWRNGYIRGWRAAREAPPACPKCGYNLSGLTHCRCPECGTEYKLDELWKMPVMQRKDSSGGKKPVE